MLFGRHRVEEDLEKIRRANLPEESFRQQDEEHKQEQEKLEQLSSADSKDIFAMILAMLSVVLPILTGLVALFLVLYFTL